MKKGAIMKIMIKSGSLRMGGLERTLIEVLQLLDKNKYNITLIIDDNSGKENIFEKDIPKEIKYYFLKSNKLIRYIDYFRRKKSNVLYKILYNIAMIFEKYVCIKKLKNIIKNDGKFELFIDFDAGAAKYIDKISIDRKIVWIHNSIPNLKKKKSKILRFMKRIEKYDKIVAICDEMKEELKSLSPDLKEKIIRIYNPFDFDRILKLKDDKSELTDEEIKLLNDDYCVAVSRLDTVQKDYNTLIIGFKKLYEKGFDKKLYIIGDGPNKLEIAKLVKENCLDDKVKLLGRFKNPYVWINNSSLFIHSSRYEGFGLVLVEAGILDKLVVSSDCHVGPKEILENGKSGVLFKTEDADDLVQKILYIDENKKESCINNMRKNIHRFDKNIIIKEIENLIDSMGEKCEY